MADVQLFALDHPVNLEFTVQHQHERIGRVALPPHDFAGG
jgi:hypothetical protein